jgi:hypothetical protein
MNENVSSTEDAKENSYEEGHSQRLVSGEIAPYSKGYIKPLLMTCPYDEIDTMLKINSCLMC